MKKVHIIGIGGIAMSAIAQYLASRDYQVSGSDLQASEITKQLKTVGIKVEIGHQASNVGPETELVICSDAIPADNVELSRAKARGIKVYSRSQALSWISEDNFVISVAGTHGKTTTSAMVTQVLSSSIKEPNFIIGGILNNFNSNYAIRDNQLFVLEGDEYNRSFLKYKSDIGVVTNVEYDHPDIYSDLADLKAAYREYISNLKQALITNWEVLAELELESKELGVDLLTVGVEDSKADFNAVKIKEEGFKSYFSLEYQGQFLLDFELPALGEYNIKHAVEAIAVAYYLDADLEAIKKGLTNWQGVKRRFEFLANNQQQVIISDYAHHPSAVKVVADDLNRIKSDKEKVFIFQPHQYIRTKRLLNDYKGLLEYDFAKIIIQKIYSVREEVSEIEVERLSQELTRLIGPKAQYCKDFAQLEKILTSYEQNNSAVYLFAGAGDIDDFARRFSKEIKEKEA